MSLINWLYNRYKSEFNRLAFDEQHIHKDWRDRCQVTYVDTEGRKYYAFADPLNDLNIERTGHVQGLLHQLSYGISADEHKKFRDALKVAVDDIINNMDAKGRIKNLAKITMAIDEVERRESLIIHPEIFLELAAVLLIREDENPATVERKVLEDKIKQFKKDEMQRDYFFFEKAGLGVLFPELSSFEKQFTEFMERGAEEMKIQKRMLDLLTTPAKSTASSKTSKKATSS